MRNGRCRGIPKIVALLVVSCATMTVTANAQIFSVPPFVQAKSDATEIAAKTEIIGREIVRGNKKIVVHPGGEVVMMSEGRDLCHIFMYVATESGSMSQSQGPGVDIPRKAGGNTVGIDASSFDAVKQEFFISGNFPMTKGQEASHPETDGKFTEKIKLLEDGKIGVNFEITMPEEQVDKFRGGEVFFRLNKTLYENEKIIVTSETENEKEILIVQKDQTALLPGSFAYVPGDEIKGFTVTAGGDGCFCIHSVAPVADTRFSCFPLALKKNKGKLSLRFVLDLGACRVVKAENIENVRGGIDFKALDDLEMPYYDKCKNLIINPSFEQGVMYCNAVFFNHNYCEGIDDFVPDTNEFVFGKHSLRVKLLNSPDSFRRFHVSVVPVTAGTYVFSFYAKGSASSKQTISLDIRSASAWPLLFSKRFNLTDQWRRYEAMLTVPAVALRIGLICQGRDESNGNNIWIDGMQMEKGAKASEFSAPPLEGALLTANEENVFNINEKINARLRIYSSKPEQSGKVRVTVKNFFSEKVLEQEIPFVTDKDGLTVLPLPLDKNIPQGVYVVKAEYQIQGKLVSRDYFRFAVMSYVMKQTGLKTLFMEIMTQSSTLWDVYPGLETYLKRCQKIGQFGDADTFRISEDNLNLHKKYGCEGVLGVISVWGWHKAKSVNFDDNTFLYSIVPWDASTNTLIDDFRLEGDGKLTEDYLARFEKVIADLVRNFPWISRWTLFSEADAAIVELAVKDPESFARLHIAFYRAVKSVSTNLQVGNSPPCNMYPRQGIQWIDQCLSQLNGRIKFDFLGGHAYYNEGPYPLDESMNEFSAMAAKHGYGPDTLFMFDEGMSYGPYAIPILGVKSSAWTGGQCWLAGPLSYDMGWTEKLSAAWYARSYLVHMKLNGRVIGATSYANALGNFALDVRLTPRAYQKIPNTLNNIFGNAKFIKDVSFAPKTRCLIFEDELGKRPIAAVWSEYGDVDQGLKESPWATAEFGKQPVEIFDLMGAERTFAGASCKTPADATVRAPLLSKICRLFREFCKRLTGASEGQAEFPVSPFPFFIKGAPGSSDSFCMAMANARLQGADVMPLKLVEKVLSPDRMELTVVNEVSRTVIGALTSGATREEITVKPLDKLVISVALPEKLEADKIKKIVVPVSLAVKDGTAISKELAFDGFVCRKTAMPKTMDGQIEDWADIPAIQLKNRNISKPAEVPGAKEGDFDGYCKTAWDKDILYLLVVIKDSVFVHDEYAGKNWKRWSNDCLQIFIDTLCDARSKNARGYDANDYDYAIFPNQEGNSSVVYRYLSPDMQLTLGVLAPPNNAIESNIPSAFSKTADGYVYEVKFPAKYLLPVKLERNSSMGFCIYAADRDEGDGVKQALTLTPPGTGGWNRPDLYPVMLLADEEGK